MIDVPRGSLTQLLGLPTDTRGVILACGSLALLLYGLAVIVGGDLVGLGYVVGALACYLFLHHRLLPALAGLLVAAAGIAATTSNPAGYAELVAGLALTASALWSPASARSPASTPPESQFVTQAPAPESTVPVVPAKAPDQPSTISLATGSRERAVPTAGVRIETIGRFRVLVNGVDATADLTRKSSVHFGWTFLLVRALADLEPIARDDFGEELAPVVGESVQRSRARKLLWAVANRLPASIGGLVVSDSRSLYFDLDRCSVDLLQLRSLADRLSDEDRIIPDEMAAETQDLIDALPPGTFLPGIDRLIQYVNQGRGSAGDAVRDLRRELTGLRADLACALADWKTARGDHAGSIRTLEPLIGETQREDLVERLTNAYMRTGQTGRANELRRPIGAPQEG